MEMELSLLDRQTEALVKEYVPNKDKLRILADFFASLADSTRIKIVSALSISPMCVGDLAIVLELNQTTVSHQLKVLRLQGVVEVNRQGKVSFYSIKDLSLLDIMFTATKFI